MLYEHWSFCSFLMQSRAMKGGPGTTSILVFLCCVALCETYGIVEKIVECSVCNSIPVQGIRSYSCKVSCDIQGKELRVWTDRASSGSGSGWFGVANGAANAFQWDQFDAPDDAAAAAAAAAADADAAAVAAARCVHSFSNERLPLQKHHWVVKNKWFT